MKVIHLISGGDVGGAKTHVLSLLAALGKEITAELVCFRDGDFANSARTLGIPTYIVDSGRISKDLSALKKLIAECGFDIVHCHGSRANFMGWLLRRRVSLPFVTTIHSDYKLDYLGRPAARLTYGVLNSYALRRLDYRIGVSDSMTDLLISRSFPPETMFTIYNGLDFSAPVKRIERREFFSRFGIEAAGDWIIAGIAARLNPVKDIKTLIRALAINKQDCPNLHLAIAGEGEELPMLRSLAAELGVSEKVHFLGWVEDMDGFYGSIDINTLTSLSETFPYALTEGARFKLPTTSSRVGGVSKLITDGECGYLFEPGDTETLAVHLMALYKDENLRSKMGNALFERARELFSLDKTKETQIGIYDSILKRYKRRLSGERNGITICGAYGHGNAGDDAILEAILSKLREYDRDMGICVLSKRPKATRQAYRVKTVFTFNPFGYRRAIKHSVLFIDGGGSLIQNVTSRRSLWFYLTTIKTAKNFGNKVMMYGCGIGPVYGKKDRKKAAIVLNDCVDIISLREDSSRDELKALGVTKPKIILSADPALTLPPSPKDGIDAAMRSFGLDVNGKYIGFAFRNWPGFAAKIDAFAHAADYAYEKHGLTPVFVPINHLSDVSAAQAVASKMKSPHVILRSLGSSGNTIGILSRMTAVVSMRLHGLIFAAGQGVPLVGIIYDPKVSAFLRYIGQDQSIALENVTFDSLKTAIENALSKSTKEQAQSVMRLRELESLNMAAVKELLLI